MLVDLETYLAACRSLGYRYEGPDIRQLYTAEAGLDLAALDADHRSMLAAADVAQGIVSLQHSVSRSLVDVWSGSAGAAAGDLVTQHDAAARTVADGFHRAAAALAMLRDELTAAVEHKVAAVLSLGDRLAGRRDTWRAVAHAVLGGGGDRSVASEIVDQQITPFVDAVVCGELAPALQAATDDVVRAYDSAIAAATPDAVRFDMPSAFGAVTPVSRTPAIGSAAAETFAPDVPAVGGVAGMAVVPQAWSPPQAAVQMPPSATAEPVAAQPAAPVTEVPAAPATAPAAASALPPDLGIGSAAGGFGRSLSDLLGGALGSAAGIAPDAAGLSDLTDGPGDRVDDVNGLDEHGDEPADDADAVGGDDGEKTAEDGPAQEGSSDATDEAAPEEPAAPAPTPPPDVVNADPPPPPVEPLAVQDQPIDKTPCQIAADELPQVGA